MIFAFVDEERGNHHASTLCKVMKVTRGGYYAWKSRPASKHAERDCEIARQIIDIHEQSRGIYGSPRIHAMLRRGGVHVSRKRVERLMCEYDIQGISKSRKCSQRCNNDPILCPEPQNLNVLEYGPWVQKEV